MLWCQDTITTSSVPFKTGVAQQVERATFNRVVKGSIPFISNIHLFYEVMKGGAKSLYEMVSIPRPFL